MMTAMDEHTNEGWIVLFPSTHQAGVEDSPPPLRELFAQSFMHWAQGISDHEREARSQACDLEVTFDNDGTRVHARYRREGHLALVQKPAGCDLLLYDLEEHRVVETYPYPKP